MAGDDDIDVELESDEVVVDVSDAPEKDVEKEKEKKTPTPRVRLQDPEDDESDPVAEATKALEEAKTAREKAERDAAAAQAAATSERQRRQEAERLAQRHGREADAARAEAETAQLTLLDRGIDGAKGEVAAYTGQLTAAYEAGDFKGAAEIQAKLSQATAKLDRLEATKEDVVANGKRKPGEVAEGRVEAQSGSALDQYLEQFAPEAQTWLRSHPECLPPQLGGASHAHSKMMAGHYAAMGQNVTPNTPDYFRVIEEHTGHRAPVSAAAETKKAGEEGDAAPAKKAARVPLAAPPSREVPTAPRGPVRRQGNSVTLSRDQQETAKMSFPHLTEKEAFSAYAKNLLELEAEGKIGRTTH